jgi:two-component sensor histidine kinase
MVAVLAAVTVYFTFAPAGFFVAATPTPLAASIAVLLMMLASNWAIGTLKISRDRLAAERERYAKLADSRDVLYREMQHRVSNNIQIISGLLMLQDQAVEDKAAKRALTEASGRINLIARIQRQLHDQTGERAPFNRFATDLLTDAIAASGARAVFLDVKGGDEPLHEDQATPVSLVMLEFVNNALEHAYTKSGGTVQVALTREGQFWLLTVTDDGDGLPEGFETGAPGSLGLKIVRTMAGQLGGTFSITRGEPGAVCRLRFPVLEA